MVEDNQQNSAKCLCPQCPSYNDCTHRQAERLYCAKDKSYCEVKEVGCICPSCPITSENGLYKTYYCLNGKA